MSDKSPADLARQLAQHVAALDAAGVDFVPAAPPVAVPPVSPAEKPTSLAQAARASKAKPAAPLPVVEQPATPVLQSSLFAGAAEVEVPDTVEGRREALEALRKQVAGCTRCPALVASRTKTVFGVGPIDPDLCVIGEAPGADEDRTGEPFVGVAGQLLTRILAAAGFRREDVFICNVLRCRPPGNRPPEAQEAENCSEWLSKTIDLVRPRFLLMLGNTPLKFVLGHKSGGITRMRGRFYEYKGLPVMLSYHPSYLNRLAGTADEMAKKREVWEDMQQLLTRMGRAVPGKK